jgi:hypothetical protein
MNPFKGKDVVLVLPGGFLMDVKSADQDITLKEESYYKVGGAGFENSYLVSHSSSINFAAVALNDLSNPPIPAGALGDAASIEVYENLELRVKWRSTGETWMQKVNMTNVKLNIAGDTLVGLSGTMKVTGRIYRNSSTSSNFS